MASDLSSSRGRDLLPQLNHLPYRGFLMAPHVQQVIGEPAPVDVDPPDQYGGHVTCLRFDGDGGWLAVGTKGGAVKLFQEQEGRYQPAGCTTAFKTQVDPLSSAEIDSKVKDLCWLKRCASAQQLVACNDKFLKLYRATERRGRMVPGTNCSDFLGVPLSAARRLRLPYFEPQEPVVELKVKHAFPSEHEFSINALSLSSDGMFFLSSDDLIIHLWHLDHPAQSLKLLSIKPECMEDLNETITTSAFHPEHGHLFNFCTSKGITHLCDLRQSVTCHQYAAVFDASRCPHADYVDMFYATLLNGISSLAYSPVNRNLFVTRDYLTLKSWDLRKSTEPLRTYGVQDELLRSALADLYETEVIFDRFEAAWTPDGRSVGTGVYRHEWVEVDVDSGRTTHHGRTLDINVSPSSSSSAVTSPARFGGADFMQKTLTLQCRPHRHLFAVGSGAEAVLYAAPRA
eukprot:EG_transcript_8219